MEHQYKTLAEVIAEQTTYRQPYKFICRECKNWIENTVGCKAGCFISTVDCKIEECFNFIKKEKT
jgi:hypothetical protein